MLGGKWVIICAVVSFMYSVPALSGTHESQGISGPRGGRFHHRRHHNQQQTQVIAIGIPISGGSGNSGLGSILNPYINSYLGCSNYLPTSNYSGFPNYSFGYWSPSNGGYGVNYTQPNIYKSYQYGPYGYGYGYPSSIYGPYSFGSYPSYTSGYSTGYPSYGYTSGYPSYGVMGYPSYTIGYPSYPQTGLINGIGSGTGSSCILLCPTQAGF
ncbi:MAG: hypothetical protein EBR01_09870 [Proteobacteria bacterium]|nr:hypothetical protein [Pseudomonadota bacterium]NBY20332.1 hypothetical protein [bacterium]